MATTALIADPRRGRSRRPSRGSGRGVGPALHPVTAVSGPAVRIGDPISTRSCRVVTAGPLADVEPGWRLTDRGLAVIMVVGLAIAVAALTVIGATVLRVTADDYRPAGAVVALD